jgi:hypothetical protein
MESIASRAERYVLLDFSSTPHLIKDLGDDHNSTLTLYSATLNATKKSLTALAVPREARFVSMLLNNLVILPI